MGMEVIENILTVLAMAGACVMGFFVRLWTYKHYHKQFRCYGYGYEKKR
jgi:hypothetical protein